MHVNLVVLSRQLMVHVKSPVVLSRQLIVLVKSPESSVTIKISLYFF